jgi:DNA polymerase elongation subunit (family B)
MTYIDAHHDRDRDLVLVTERVNGKRIIKELPPVYEFFYADERGSEVATTGERLKRVNCRRHKDFKKELRVMGTRKTFEADHNIIFKTLKKNYANADPAKLNVAFFDIEVDFDLAKGYSTTDDPFNPVTAVSVYCTWLDRLFTLVVRPETLTDEEAQEIVSEFPDTMLCTETELLLMFQDLIEDADVISGWNSEAYDVPYMINRTIRVLNKQATLGWCLWGMQPIRGKTKDNFGRENLSFTLKGRLHIDYLDLFKKHTPAQMPSYKLDYVGEAVVNENKVKYQGSLYQLYREDFKKFIEYNRQDTLLLHKIDQKLKYLDLANQLATTNGVLISSTMGTVAWVDQSIINAAHSRGLRVPTKHSEEEIEAKAAGAWVAEPRLGLQEWIGLVDINSLYPSCIRMLNMSPDTIVGQIRSTYTEKYLENKIISENLIFSVKGVKKKDYTAAWNGLFGTLEYNMVMDKTSDELTVDFMDGTVQVMTAEEWYHTIFQPDSNINISANGTIFRTDKEGLIPGLLTQWYRERQEMQFTKKLWGELKYGISEESNLIDEMHRQIPGEYRKLHNGKWCSVDEEYTSNQIEFWDKRQLVRKIQLNSLYGCLLNGSSKFHDRRMGQSVTLTGRCITKHMASKINEIIAGTYDHEGDALIYGDTDSVVGDTRVRSNMFNVGEMPPGQFTPEAVDEGTIEELFDMCDFNEDANGNQKAVVPSYADTLSYDSKAGQPTRRKIKNIHRHKVTKPKWKLVTESGKEVTMTDDHSLVVVRNGKLIEVKPSEVDPLIDQVVSLP